jgi:flavin-dependent thymidylate synthase
MKQNNTVELIGVYGSDETHAMSAWTSTSREITDEKFSRIPSLLKMLATGTDGNSHGTPFEKSMLHFLVTSDVATHIQLLKHRIGVSISAESARYKELKEDKYYVPEEWPEYWKNALENYTDAGNELYHKCLNSLVNEYGMDRKRAKETARYFRNYNSQITIDISFNFRSFVHFLKLRNAPSAQKEIREIAEKMLTLIKETGKFEHSLNAFNL